MITNIYVNNNNNVETYIAYIDLEKLKQLEKRIDISFGKGEPRTYRGRYLKAERNKKVEILTQKQVGWGNPSQEDYFKRKNMPIYKFRYYEYQPHFLSIICQYFIDHQKCKYPLEFSNRLRELFSFIPTNKKERKYFYEILSCFNFKKYDLETLVASDIDLQTKISLLTKIKCLLIKTKELPKSKHLPKSYMDLINEKLAQREYGASYKNLCNIKYTKEQRNRRKIRALNSLPKQESFERHNLIKTKHTNKPN